MGAKLLWQESKQLKKKKKPETKLENHSVTHLYAAMTLLTGERKKVVAIKTSGVR